MSIKSGTAHSHKSNRSGNVLRSTAAQNIIGASTGKLDAKAQKNAVVLTIDDLARIKDSCTVQDKSNKSNAMMDDMKTRQQLSKQRV